MQLHSVKRCMVHFIECKYTVCNGAEVQSVLCAQGSQHVERVESWQLVLLKSEKYEPGVLS